jgi:WXG100 family type VII secretion target
MSDGEGRHLEVDHATLHQAAREIRAANDDVNKHLATVRGAAEVLGSAWTGQAATAFTGLMARWDADAKQLAAAMQDIARLLDESANRHQSMDEESMSVLNRMDSSVDHILHPHS